MARTADTRTKRGRTAGFTLLEVLVAVAILSISLTSLLTSQMQALRATRYAQEVSAAVFLAEYQLIEIEWELKRDGWGDADKDFEGDFAELGWPDTTYKCFVDMVELPEYQALKQAADASESGGVGGIGNTSGVRDAQGQAFDSLGMVWPLVKNAVERAIRKVWCKVYWQDLSRSSSQKDIDQKCCEVVVSTFWTDVSKLDGIAEAGGEVDETDDSRSGGGAGGPGGGAGGPGGGAGGGAGGRGGEGGVRGGGGPVTPGGARGGGR
jgi:prepilin-type N-terminal cleavage/methylation domain-containing protein